MPRRIAFYIGLLQLTLAPASAAVSSGNDWTLERSVHGILGDGNLKGYAVDGSTWTLGQSMGEPYDGLLIMTAAAEAVLTGYLAQIPSISTAGSSVTNFMSSVGVTMNGVTYGLLSTATVAIAFNNEMSSATLAAAITVTATQDPLGNTITAPLTFNLIYSATAQTCWIYPTDPAGWPKGTLFELTLSSYAKDVNGLALPSNQANSFSSVRDMAAVNLFKTPGDPNMTLEIPANAFASDYFLVISSVASSSSTLTNATDRLVQTLGPERKPLRVVQVDPFEASGAAWKGTLAGNASLGMPYSDADGDGFVDDTNPRVKAKSLTVWRLDEAGGFWVKQPGAVVDLANKRVLLPTNHFSVLAQIGALDTDVSESYAFPVPFRPNAGDVVRYGSWSDGIRFTNLPSGGTIRIYTVSGELVRELVINTNPQTWDVKNTAGEIVSSGVYLWEIKSSTARKTGKLMVVR